MKRFIIVSALCVTFAFLGCQETKEDVKIPISDKDLYKKIGEEIPFETGMEWIALYQGKNNAQGRTASDSGYSVPSAEMNQLLESVSDLTGVAFHYGIDEQGSNHILVIPVDGSMDVWSSNGNKFIVDANTGTQISEEVASLWSNNFKQANPSSIWFHFFGKDIFDEMRALPYYHNISIERAISSLDQTPQLLLVVWNEQQASSSGRLLVFGSVYDASNACPPCAVL
jgi:hypothetical protein